MLKHAIHLNKYEKRLSHNNFHEEYQYLNLIRDILEEGEITSGRNGITKSVFGTSMHFSLENNKIPIFTTKKVAYKTCLKELLWFIKGDTNNNHLKEQKVNIWNGNSSTEFKKSIGLENLKDGDLGPIYGWNWRHFGASYIDCDTNYKDQGTDQLQNVINILKDPKQRTSRRMIVTALDPSKVKEAVLPPCHVFFQFNVKNENQLSCSVYCRSQDVALGQPFNVTSYAFLTHLIAKHCDLEANEIILYAGNCHIYEEHIESMKEQIQRIPYQFPEIKITKKYESIEEYTLEDFEIENYSCHSKIKMDMIA
tara:strand:- start:3905 stop:4834 length:930 start_codon:yes stop_codon:yes gene_type:complete